MRQIKGSDMTKKYKSAIEFQDNGVDVYNIYKLLGLIGKKHKTDFWDAKGFDGDFDRWCDSRGLPQKDPEGKKRSQSNIWFKEQKNDIKMGLWKEAEYCPTIDVFVEVCPEATGLEGSNVVEDVTTSCLMDEAIRQDKAQYGKEDYRVRLIDIFIKEMGDFVKITGEDN